MASYQINRFLGILLTILGAGLFLIVSWEFLLHAAIALAALYVVGYGLKLQGYPFSRILFMMQSWRSRF